MKRVMRTTSDCVLIAILCFSMVFVAITPVAFADLSDTILMRVTSENEDEYIQAIGTQIATTVNPVYGYMFSTIDDYLELKDMSQSMIYDPATDEGGMALVDENADVGYALAEDGSLIRIDGFYGRSHGGGRSRVDSADDVKISSATFAEICQMYEDHYAPKNTADYISWRTDSRFSRVGDSGLTAPRLSFFTDGYFCGESTWTECFLVPWYTDGTTDYFSQYQLHFYQVVSEDDSGKRIITMYCDVWDMVNGGDVQTLTISDQIMDYRYIDFCVSTELNRLMMTPYASYTDYINRTRRLSLTPSFTMTQNIGKNIVYSADGLTSANINDFLSCWQKAVTTHDEGACSVAELHDTGYYVSNKQIYMNFDFVDLSQFTKEDVVTLTGDTFYDYTITNSTTGDSTTVYNYITNNYNYPVSEDSSDDTIDSGSVSGDVNVSGNIDVGGSVDVNVNVNTNGSADGGSMPVDVDLNNYLEQTPEQAKPITEFFSIFFDFLPPELLGLICLGVAVAIILRIWGR